MDKEQTAMERLRLASDMSLRLYGKPLLLTDSGGKDSAVICKLANQNFTLRSTIAPRRTKSILGSWNVSAGTESSGAAITFWIISAARHA